MNKVINAILFMCIIACIVGMVMMLVSGSEINDAMNKYEKGEGIIFGPPDQVRTVGAMRNIPAMILMGFGAVGSVFIGAYKLLSR